MNRIADLAWQSEPELGTDDNRRTEQEEPGSVAAQRRVEVTRAGADSPRCRADQMGQTEPDRDQSGAEPSENRAPRLPLARSGTRP